MAHKDNVKAARQYLSGTQKSPIPMNPKPPHKDADSTIALSKKTLDKIEAALDTLTGTARENVSAIAVIIKEMLDAINESSVENSETIKAVINKVLLSEVMQTVENLSNKLIRMDMVGNDISKDLGTLVADLDMVKGYAEGGYGVEELTKLVREALQKPMTVHLDNADNLVNPQPVIVSLSEEFRDVLAKIQAIKTPKVEVKADNTALIQAITKLNDRPVYVNVEKGPESGPRTWEFTFNRDDRGLTQSITAREV